MKRTLPPYHVTTSADDLTELHPTTIAMFNRARANPVTSAQLSAMRGQQKPAAPALDPAQQAAIEAKIAQLERDIRVARMGPEQQRANLAAPISASAQLSALIDHHVGQGMSKYQATRKVYGEHHDLVAKWSAELSADKTATTALLSASPDRSPEAEAYRCQAIAEAKANPEVTKGFTSLTSFVIVRAAELSGRLRTSHAR